MKLKELQHAIDSLLESWPEKEDLEVVIEYLSCENTTQLNVKSVDADETEFIISSLTVYGC